MYRLAAFAKKLIAIAIMHIIVIVLPELVWFRLKEWWWRAR